MKEKIIKMIRLLGLIYLIYLLYFSLVYPSRPNIGMREKVLEKDKKINQDEYIDSAYIVESPEEALEVRINMLDSAEERVDIAYYKIDRGHTSEIFLWKLLETADRGVKVRIYLDGILNDLRGDVKAANYAFANHPNIEYRWHQPLNILKPWTFNNRLHDKIILVDNKLALVGGRNIGDRFFDEKNTDYRIVYDRDLLVYNSQSDSRSVISQVEEYFNQLWTSSFSKDVYQHLSRVNIEKASNFRERLNFSVENYWQDEALNYRKIVWHEKTKPVKRIEYVHNELGQGGQARALRGLLELAEKSEDIINVQSPYIIPSKNMRKIVKQYRIDYSKINILTNSFYASPNIMAMSGYKRNRLEIEDKTNSIYEYYNDKSIHAKSYSFDNEIAVIGSFNMDPRSSFLSSESYFVVYDQELTKELNNKIENLKKSSYKLDDEAMRDDIVDNKYRLKLFLLKILSPFSYFFEELL